MDEWFLQATKHVVKDCAVVKTLEQLDEFGEQFVTMFPEWLDNKKLAKWLKVGTRHAWNPNKWNKVRLKEELDDIRVANMYDLLLY